jgi:hypothetical protein
MTSPFVSYLHSALKESVMRLDRFHISYLVGNRWIALYYCPVISNWAREISVVLWRISTIEFMTSLPFSLSTYSPLVSESHQLGEYPRRRVVVGCSQGRARYYHRGCDTMQGPPCPKWQFGTLYQRTIEVVINLG